MRDLEQTVARLPTALTPRLPPPPYLPWPDAHAEPSRVMLAVASMREHTSDEGFQLALALEHAGYKLVGHGFPRAETDVGRMLVHLQPQIVVVQDKREWDVTPGDFRDPRAAFTRVNLLAQQPDVFRVTVLKDAHQRPDYHRQSAAEIGCHAHIIYYHPDLVCHLAPYVRREHLVRTWHSVDAALVPAYQAQGRKGCLLSGALSKVYPLRARLFKAAWTLPDVTLLPHPGYHRRGCATPAYLQTLSRHQVAICTSSIYGYALRKLIEATACGCRVITDLPKDEVLPMIDGNLVRISPSSSVRQVEELLRQLYVGYEPARQEDYAKKALAFYDYRVRGLQLAADIEKLRSTYP